MEKVIEESTLHKREVNLGDGKYLFDIMCTDRAGKSDRTYFNFDVRRQVYPDLRRIYKENNLLTIEVSEPSECKYSDRNFNYDDGAIQKMASSNNGLKHQALLQNLFYIKCKNMNNNNINSEPFIIYP